MSDKRLFLLDGHALVYRAHYAFITRPLMNSKGMNTSAVMGFLRTLWELMQNQKPTHIAVSFDLSGPTFRHEMYEPYKANREEQPEDISNALPYIKELVEAFNIPVVTYAGFEADDVIGTLAKQAEAEGFEVYMVTPDKDYAQLVSDNIYMYKPARMGNGAEILGKKEILESWGIARVEQVIDILGLQGDAVDNIPGVPGIGPKTAQKLLLEFDSVENLLKNAHNVKGKNGERLVEFAEQARLSKILATIDIDVPIQFNAKRYELEPFNREKLEALFKELEFRTLAQQILASGENAPSPAARPGQQQSLFDAPVDSKPLAAERPEAPPAHSVANKNIYNTEHVYHLAHTAEERRHLINLLARQSSICIDTETTSTDPNQAELVGLSFAVQPHEAWYVPCPADQDACQRILDDFRPILENPAIEKIGQNIKYDALVLRWYGIELKGFFFDTMIAHYLLEPELRHNMDYLAETYLKYQPVPISTLLGKKPDQYPTMREVPIEKILDYAAEDADITLQLRHYLAPRLEEENLFELYKQVEEPMIKALVEMELQGVRIDSEYLLEYSRELEEQISLLEKEIYEAAGRPFNINSPKQVGELLFDQLNIPYRWSKTKTGQYSTNEEKLAELSGEHPVIEKILDHRGLNKLKSTYVDALPRMVNPRSGRIHSSFNQALTATGRLSSNNPNLQNIPVRTPEGARVREAFVPRDANHILLAADYSQIELRLIAEISGDELMLEAFQSGKDIHSATAAQVFEVPYEEVTKEQRYRAKTVNFSIIYGAGAQNLSRQLDIKRAEAKELIDSYFNKYQGLRRYMDQIVADAREQGYVTTLLGRRRHLRDIDSRNGVIRSHAERNAVNTPIQGTAADLIKLAMISLHQYIQEEGLQSRIILQVHDELVFDAHRSELERLKPVIEEKMRNALPSLKVPLLVEIGEGENWLQAH